MQPDKMGLNCLNLGLHPIYRETGALPTISHLKLHSLIVK